VIGSWLCGAGLRIAWLFAVAAQESDLVAVLFHQDRLAGILQVGSAAIGLPAALVIEIQRVQHGFGSPILEVVAC